MPGNQTSRTRLEHPAQRARRLYEAGDLEPAGTPKRAALYRQAAQAQQEAERHGWFRPNTRRTAA
jgi:hypothetical protein